MKIALIEINKTLLLSILSLPEETKITDCMSGDDNIVLKITHPELKDVDLGEPTPVARPKFVVVSNENGIGVKPRFLSWGQENVIS